ncbi:MAG: hypothetical protein ABIV28_02940 [Longimicrobiales bacterium]
MAKRENRPKKSYPSGAAVSTPRLTSTQRAARARVDEPDLPRWVAPVAFLVATVLLFPEVIFKGNTLFGTDTFGLSYFARNFYTTFVRNMHAFPLWDPMVLGGLPFLEGMHGDIFYPPSLALFFLDAKAMWAWKMVLHIFLAGVFMYLWLRRGMKLRRGSAIFGGVVFMMGADLVSLVSPGGDGKLFVSVLAPLVFWLAERAASGRRISDFAGFALGITLILLTSHMQSAYFCVWGVTAYFFFRVWQIWRAERNGALAARLIGMFALAGILGTGAAAIQFLPPLEYLRSTSLRVDQRKSPAATYLAATEYALHPEELASLVVPDFVGSTITPDNKPTYWGRNGFKLNSEYAGVIALLLLPILFLRRRTARTWFFTGLGAVTLLYAAGATTPLFHLFLMIPGVKLFRAPSIIIFLYALSICTLGALALERLLALRGGDDDETQAVTRYMWIMTGLTAILAVFASSGGLLKVWLSFYNPGEQGGAGLAENLPHMEIGFWLLFIMALLVALWWTGLRKSMFGGRLAIAVIIALAAIDLYRVDRPFVKATASRNDEAEQYGFFKPNDAQQFLIAQAQGGKHVFRAADYDASTRPLSRNTLAIHGIEQVGGLHGNEIGRYAALVGGADAPNIYDNKQLLDLVNTEYIVFPGKLQQSGPLEEAFVGQTSVVYRNRSVLPRAFLVGGIRVAPDSVVLPAMQTGQLNLHAYALIADSTPEFATIQPDPVGGADWVERTPNRMKLRVTSDRPALLVITDNYYPSWKATVGGKPATIHRTDYTFRGIVVPAGASDVEMHYDASHLRMAAFTSIALILLLVGAVVGGMIRREPAGAETVHADDGGEG